MAEYEKAVFISYAWGTERESIVSVSAEIKITQRIYDGSENFDPFDSKIDYIVTVP